MAELSDIPGTRVFTTALARKGYWINQFAMSLMKAANREAFVADPAAYVAQWPLAEDARSAVLERRYNDLLDMGGNIYFLVKLMYVDGISVARGVAAMTELSFDAYQEMMQGGGRSPAGNRSISKGY